MKILAIDSTAKVASAAVAENENLLAYFVADNGLTHSELLLPMAEAVCRSARCTRPEIDLFAVTVGPGSFTGVRIGVATVKGLAFDPTGEEARCIPVSTLEALAQNLAPLDGLYCPVMDARRSEVYNALFRMENGRLCRLCEDRAISLEALCAELCERYPDIPVRLCGDGYEVAARALEGRVNLIPTPPLLRPQNAASVAVCAYRAYLRGETVSERALTPIYLRLPQAERERLAKMAAENAEK